MSDFYTVFCGSCCLGMLISLGTAITAFIRAPQSPHKDF